MKIDLNKEEREFLYDKAFWAKMYVGIDVMAALTPEAKEFYEKEYKFYDDLCKKLDKEEKEGEK